MINWKISNFLVAGYIRGIKPTEPVQEKLRVNLLLIYLPQFNAHK